MRKFVMRVLVNLNNGVMATVIQDDLFSASMLSEEERKIREKYAGFLGERIHSEASLYTDLLNLDWLPIGIVVPWYSIESRVIGHITYWYKEFPC